MEIELLRDFYKEALQRVAKIFFGKRFSSVSLEF
jgi:hypothetical protein